MARANNSPFGSPPSSTSSPGSAPTSTPANGPGATRTTINGIVKYWKHVAGVLGAATLATLIGTGVLKPPHIGGRSARRYVDDQIAAPYVRAAAANPDRIWETILTGEMDLAKNAEMGMRAILLYQRQQRPFTLGDQRVINATLNNPALPEQVKQQMRAKIPPLYFDGTQLEASALNDLLSALNLASAEFSRQALERFSQTVNVTTVTISDADGGVRSVGGTGENFAWLEYINSHLDSNVAEPGHMSAIVLCLWRSGRLLEAKALATRIFELPSWQSYKQAYPCEAADVISICSRTDNHVPPQPMVSQPVSHEELLAMKNSCARDGGVTVADVTSQPTVDASVTSPAVDAGSLNIPAVTTDSGATSPDASQTTDAPPDQSQDAGTPSPTSDVPPTDPAILAAPGGVTT